MELVFVYRPDELDEGKMPEDPVPDGNEVKPDVVTVSVVREVTTVVLRPSLEELEDDVDGSV